MIVIEQAREMQRYAEALRRKGKRIVFVPTMGFLHRGHLSLMEDGKQRGDCLVTSIYVNPTQFGPAEDLDKYPRDFDTDCRLCRGVGVDAIFFPSNGEMYPEHYQTYVDLGGVTQNLCGLSRPGHFRGVATVCAKLFNLVKPHVAVFGKKDFQQLVVIRRMVADLNMDLEIVGLDTVREPDGLAMSSRNTYLKPEERESALSLSRGLKLAQEMYAAGERDAGVIIAAVSRFIAGHPHAKIDYVKICDTTTMKDAARLDGECVMALAVRVGAARLIDNSVFGEPLLV
ncbi:MAG TPA: pantoate--beta-alanine ligase [Syntrophales bacterium]|jgi:pantoate--beta-alanine ligase|nr:pantoate--beta-alanine ligase [Syntrophaceae bacterium]MBP7033412.1 pantoate--beta-alanine ligase [Syntrophobacterales bacterium]NLX31168.1 pantoate--beta-alanine ligase [Deltaproteobacteria bacterium]HNU85287.1 pantoate--beta-alanine ligase [Syntrophales bacterium]HNZ34735.1 pantoate--beta-alanine ligase [Syntrophales bacterium]